MIKEKKRLLVFFFLICIECFAIGYILRILLQRPENVQRNALSRSLLQFVPSDELRYYYTFQSDSNYVESASWLPEQVQYHFNKDGLADETDYDVTKDEGIFRIMTLGDSFVFGMWVKQSNNFSKQLEKLLNTTVTCPTIQKFEVINLGAPGFDARYTVKRYTDIGAKYHPDFVVWFLRGENIYMNMDRYREQEEIYKQKGIDDDTASKYHVDKQDEFAPSKIAYEEYIDAFENLSKKQQKIFIDPEIEAIQSLIKQLHIPLLFLIPQEEEKRYKEQLKAFILPNSLLSYQEIEGIETFSPNDYHPSVQGHARIAQTIFDNLLSYTLQSCSKKQE